MPQNKILNSSNAALTVTNLTAAGTGGTSTLEGVPIGTATGGAASELGLKVIVIANTGGSASTQIVVGPSAVGDDVTGAPVLVGGKDSAGHAEYILVTAAGAVRTSPGAAPTATLANKNYSGSNQTLAAANAARLGLLIFNDTDGALFLKYGATAATSSFTVKIAAGGYWEMPSPLWAGIVDGIGTGGTTGATRVTELT